MWRVASDARLALPGAAPPGLTVNVPAHVENLADAVARVNNFIASAIENQLEATRPMEALAS